MTLEELINCSADKLEALNDAELYEYFKPYFEVTRPDLAAKKRELGERQRAPQQLQLTEQQKKGFALLQAEGVDLSFLQRKGKR